LKRRRNEDPVIAAADLDIGCGSMSISAGRMRSPAVTPAAESVTNDSSP